MPDLLISMRSGEGSNDDQSVNHDDTLRQLNPSSDGHDNRVVGTGLFRSENLPERKQTIIIEEDQKELQIKKGVTEHEKNEKSQAQQGLAELCEKAKRTVYTEIVARQASIDFDINEAASQENKT